MRYTRLTATHDSAYARGSVHAYLLHGEVPTLVDAPTSDHDLPGRTRGGAACGGRRPAWRRSSSRTPIPTTSTAPSAVHARWPAAVFRKRAPLPQDDGIDWQVIEKEPMVVAGDRELWVLHTPGHAPDHSCLFDVHGGTLIGGDLAINGSTVAIPADHGGSLRQYLQSLRAVLELQPAGDLPEPRRSDPAAGLVAARLPVPPPGEGATGPRMPRRRHRHRRRHRRPAVCCHRRRAEARRAAERDRAPPQACRGWSRRARGRCLAPPEYLMLLYCTDIGLVLVKGGRSLHLAGLTVDELLQDPGAVCATVDARRHGAGGRRCDAAGTAGADRLAGSLGGRRHLQPQPRRADGGVEAGGGGDFYDQVYTRRAAGAVLQGDAAARRRARAAGPHPRRLAAGTCPSRSWRWSSSPRVQDRRLHDRQRHELPRHRGREPALPAAGQGLRRQCCALGPCVAARGAMPPPPADGDPPRRSDARRRVGLRGRDDARARWPGRFEDLVDWLGRDNSFPTACILLTGTGIVPPDEFTLQPATTSRSPSTASARSPTRWNSRRQPTAYGLLATRASVCRPSEMLEC